MTLVALAERTGVMVVATIDQRDFSVYRARGQGLESCWAQDG